MRPACFPNIDNNARNAGKLPHHRTPIFLELPNFLIMRPSMDMMPKCEQTAAHLPHCKDLENEAGDGSDVRNPDGDSTTLLQQRKGCNDGVHRSFTELPDLPRLDMM